MILTDLEGEQFRTDRAIIAVELEGIFTSSPGHRIPIHWQRRQRRDRYEQLANLMADNGRERRAAIGCCLSECCTIERTGRPRSSHGDLIWRHEPIVPVPVEYSLSRGTVIFILHLRSLLVPVISSTSPIFVHEIPKLLRENSINNHCFHHISGSKLRGFSRALSWQHAGDESDDILLQDLWFQLHPLSSRPLDQTSTETRKSQHDVWTWPQPVRNETRLLLSTVVYRTYKEWEILETPL